VLPEQNKQTTLIAAFYSTSPTQIDYSSETTQTFAQAQKENMQTVNLN